MAFRCKIHDCIRLVCFQSRSHGIHIRNVAMDKIITRIILDFSKGRQVPGIG